MQLSAVFLHVFVVLPLILGAPIASPKRKYPTPTGRKQSNGLIVTPDGTFIHPEDYEKRGVERRNLPNTWIFLPGYDPNAEE